MDTDQRVTVTVTDDDFEREIERHAGLAVVDFGAAWCGPCRMIAPIIDQLARQYAGRVKIGTLDVDSSPATAARFGVRSLPTILFFANGALVATIVGAVPKSALERKVEELLAAGEGDRALDPVA